MSLGSDRLRMLIWRLFYSHRRVYVSVLLLLFVGATATFLFYLVNNAAKPSYQRMGQYLIVRGGFRTPGTQVYFVPKSSDVGHENSTASPEAAGSYVPLIAKLHNCIVRGNWVIGETPREGFVAIDTLAEPQVSIITAMERGELEGVISGIRKLRILVLPWQEGRGIFCVLVGHRGPMPCTGALEFIIDGRVYYRVPVVSGSSDLLFPVIIPMPERSTPLLLYAQLISEEGRPVQRSQRMELQPGQQNYLLTAEDTNKAG